MSKNIDVNNKLHKYAFEGRNYRLKSLLKDEKSLVIDSKDSKENTPLHYACLNGHKNCVKTLLKHGSNPNERGKIGETPVHVTCATGDIKILELLIQYGGDLRLHDNDGRLPRDWANFQDDKNIRIKMISFIEEAKHKVLSTHIAKLINNIPNTSNIYTSSKQKNFQTPGSVGFGPLYNTMNDLGVPIVVPIVNEIELEHDDNGLTFNNGVFMVYESIKSNRNGLVSIKRLHDKPLSRESLDLLIDELKFLSRIRCSNTLQLLGICQTANINNIILMFERIEMGSLFYILHEKEVDVHFKLKNIYEIILSICNALMYLHGQNIIHCYVSSHSIMMASTHVVKLANFEYAVEKASKREQQKKSRIVENHYVNCIYNWLAPEIMDNKTPSEMSDMYSLCVVMWELFNRIIPWSDISWDNIKTEILVNNKTLPVDFETIKFPFNRIIKDGLSKNEYCRMKFEEVKNTLENPNQSIYSNSIFNDMTEDTITNLFEIDRKGTKIDEHTFTSVETQSDIKPKQDLIKVPLFEKKKTKAPPPPPPCPPPPIPQAIVVNNNCSVKSPVCIRKQNSFNGFNSPLRENKNNNINKTIVNNIEPAEQLFVSSLTLPRRGDTLVKKQQSSDKNKNNNNNNNQNNCRQLNFSKKSTNFDDNLAKPTPDEKRNYFTQKNKTNLNDSIKFSSPIKKLDLSAISVEDNTIDRNNVKASDSFSQIYSNNNQIGNKQQIDVNNNVITNIEQQKNTDLPKGLEKYCSDFQKSQGYVKLIGEVKNYLHGSNEGTRNITPRGLSVDSIRTPKNRNSQPEMSTNLETLNNQMSKCNIGSSSLQNSSSVRSSRDSRFFSGNNSVKDLVKSYEDLPHSEKTSSNFKVQQMRQERNKELLNVVCRGRFIPSDENKYRANESTTPINPINENTKKVPTYNINAQLPPKHKPSINLNNNDNNNNQSKSNVADLNNTNSNNKKINNTNKKDLSTISEGTERSSSLIDSRDILNRVIINKKNDEILSNQNIKYKTETVILANQFDNVDDKIHINNKSTSIKNIVPKLDEEPQSKIFNKNDLTDITRTRDDLILRTNRIFNESSQEDILSTYLDDASIECSEAVYLTEFDSFAKKYKSSSLENILNINGEYEYWQRQSSTNPNVLLKNYK